MNEIIWKILEIFAYFCIVTGIIFMLLGVIQFLRKGDTDEP
jgi:multisubunit Na+/H+ antiporter MnhG subunit